MEGSVSWTAEGQESSYGRVTICKQVGSKLNILFSCENWGEGQVTLAITKVEQFASARFVYAGASARTYAGVVGRMDWELGSLQFEGLWDDQDYDTVWSFTIEIENFNFAEGTLDVRGAPDPDMESLDEILGTLDRRYLTDWFDPEVAPARPGAYRVEPHFSANEYVAYATWDGMSWSGVRLRASELDNLVSHDVAFQGGRFWRGLTEEGARRVSMLLDGVRQRDIERTNSDLISRLRQDEANLERARAEAYAVYRQLLEQINRSGYTEVTQQALRNALNQLVGVDFDSSAEATFDETVAQTVEDMHALLLAARKGCDERTGYWRNYWVAVLAKHSVLAHELTSKGLLVGYGKDMQARLGKNASMQPLPGSFGTKPRQ